MSRCHSLDQSQSTSLSQSLAEKCINKQNSIPYYRLATITEARTFERKNLIEQIYQIDNPRARASNVNFTFDYTKKQMVINLIRDDEIVPKVVPIADEIILHDLKNKMTLLSEKEVQIDHSRRRKSFGTTCYMFYMSDVRLAHASQYHLLTPLAEEKKINELDPRVHVYLRKESNPVERDANYLLREMQKSEKTKHLIVSSTYFNFYERHLNFRSNAFVHDLISDIKKTQNCKSGEFLAY